MMRRGLLLGALLACSGAWAAPCAMSAADRDWSAGALARWDEVRGAALRLEPAQPATIVLFDAACVWHVAAGEVQGFTHDGAFALPGGDSFRVPAPPRPTAFTSAHEGAPPFLVFSLPAVWRQSPGVQSNPRLDQLVRAVLVHEMTHTRHQVLFATLDAIERSGKVGDDFNDDFIQAQYGQDEAFQQAYVQERDLLFQAAASTDPREQRALAARALASMRQRHARHFTGERSRHAEIESIFLTMEGVANWAACQSAIKDGLARDDAIRLVRGSGKHWVQEQGLALFLALDAMLPDWQQRVFRQAPMSVTELLAAAIGRD